MPDVLTPAQRSANMARIRGKDTKPEMVVRRMVHALGYRFRLHRRDLPGSPDLVFPSRRKVILVHGCFWHRHPGCRFSTVPRTRPEFWEAKFARNTARDAENIADLGKAGWNVLVVWECETRDIHQLADRMTTFLGPSGRSDDRQDA